MEIRINILHVVPTLNPASGGVSQAVRNMIRYVNEVHIGHEVLCLDGPNADYLHSLHFKVHALGNGKTAWNYHAQLIPWLREHLNDYHCVISHGLWQYQSYALRNVLKNHPHIQLYLMPHGMLDPYFQRAGHRRLKAIRNYFIWHLVEQRLVSMTDAVLFTCEQERVLAREPFSRYQPSDEYVIGLGVGLPPKLSTLKAGKIKSFIPEITKGYLLFLGRIDFKKGVDLLIHAYLKLKKEGLKLPQLVIAGPGLEGDFGKSVVKLASADQDILFPGMLTGDRKWMILYGCEAFILPSHQENFGIAVAEALACGKPVLISDQVNIWREIEMANAGLVAPDNLTGTEHLLTGWVNTTTTEKTQYSLNAKACYRQHYAENIAREIFLDFLRKKR